MHRKKVIPQRVQPKDDKRRLYQRSLAEKPVSRTDRSFASRTDAEEKLTVGGTIQEAEEKHLAESTAYIPAEEDVGAELHYEDTRERAGRSEQLKLYLEIAGGIIGVVIFIAIAVSAYNNLTNKVDNVKDDLRDYKSTNNNTVQKMEKDLKDDMRYLSERMDKYISKKP